MWKAYYVRSVSQNVHQVISDQSLIARQRGYLLRHALFIAERKYYVNRCGPMQYEVIYTGVLCAS